MNFSREAVALYRALNRNKLTHAMLVKAGPSIRTELASLIRVAGGGVNPHAALRASMGEFASRKVVFNG